MLYVWPDYYGKFKCIADRCEATCCAGWQIVIDEEALERYESGDSDYGAILRDRIDWEEGVFHQDCRKRCAFLKEDNLCEICKDKNRLSEILCVVDDPKNIILFEKLDIFKGYYHVINGLISPLDGINPEDIKIDELIDRIKKEKVKEVIIAVKPSIEGETTALYISKILKNIDVKVSRIAYGVPVGAEIDYVDSLTLEMALENRKEISTNE